MFFFTNTLRFPRNPQICPWFPSFLMIPWTRISQTRHLPGIKHQTRNLLQNIRINLILICSARTDKFWKGLNITNAYNVPVVPNCQFKFENPSIYILVSRWFCTSLIFLFIITSLIFCHILYIRFCVKKKKYWLKL